MKRHNWLILAAALLPASAFAQTPPPSPEMVLLPRSTAEAALGWVASPNAMTAVQLYAALAACIQDNPSNGRLVRMGADQCPAVTEALAAQVKATADAVAKQKADDAKPAEPPAAPPKP